MPPAWATPTSPISALPCFSGCPKPRRGDRAELSLDQPTDWATWQRFSAQDTDCLSRQNRFVRDGQCFLMRARKAAESAHLVIVNHALLLADIASNGSALPPYDT